MHETGIVVLKLICCLFGAALIVIFSAVIHELAHFLYLRNLTGTKLQGIHIGHRFVGVKLKINPSKLRTDKMVKSILAGPIGGLIFIGLLVIVACLIPNKIVAITLLYGAFVSLHLTISRSLNPIITSDGNRILMFLYRTDPNLCHQVRRRIRCSTWGESIRGLVEAKKFRKAHPKDHSTLAARLCLKNEYFQLGLEHLEFRKLTHCQAVHCKNIFLTVWSIAHILLYVISAMIIIRGIF